MRFVYPHILWALLALPILAAFLAWGLRRRRRLLERYASSKLLPTLGVDLRGWHVWMKPILLLLAAALVIFSAARPQWGYEDRKLISRGVDIMVAVDTSNSMLAQDYRPSRLDRAKQLLQDIIWRARGDRVGVMAFAGSAAIQSPLTLDYAMASAALKALNQNSVAAGGTAIGEAIRGAIRAFKSASAGERVLVLLTDGEDQGSQPIEAAQEAAQAGIRIYTIGIGTSQGGPIPMEGGYKTDKQGQVVQSKLDFETLTRIAQITGGKSVKANPRGGAELDAILGELDQLTKAEQQDKIYRVYRERFQWFLIPAFLLLALEALMTGSLRRRVSPRSGVALARPAPAAAAAALALMLMAGSAAAYPGEDRVLSSKALKAYEGGNYQQAQELYKQAASKATDNAPEATFNAGAAAYKSGKVDEAEQAFRSVFDQENRELNAAAGYNLGVLEHKRAQPAVEKARQIPETSQVPPEQAEALKKELQGGVKTLEKALRNYRDAILRAPGDQEMKVNHELASRDLELLREKLRELEPPPQQSPDSQNQDEQQKQQQNQQNQQQNQQNQQQNQQNQQQQQDQQQNQQDQQQSQNEQQQQQNQDQKQDSQNQPQQPGEKPEESGKDQEGSSKPEEKKDEENPQDGQPQDQKQQPEQTDGKQPQPQKGDPGKKDQSAGGSAGQTGEEPEAGKMSERDVERLLNSLPSENQNALQRLLNVRSQDTPMEKDW